MKFKVVHKSKNKTPRWVKVCTALSIGASAVFAASMFLDSETMLLATGAISGMLTFAFV